MLRKKFRLHVKLGQQKKVKPRYTKEFSLSLNDVGFPSTKERKKSLEIEATAVIRY